MNIVPVIMSGGAGSRLWPLSRETYPKPLIALPDGETLIRKTYARAAALRGVELIVTVTNRELMVLTADEFDLQSKGRLQHDLILEPMGRDTAPAVALACLHLAGTTGADAIALVMPADHLITDHGAFEAAVDQAVQAAREGRIATFGIRPDRLGSGTCSWSIRQMRCSFATDMLSRTSSRSMTGSDPKGPMRPGSTRRHTGRGAATRCWRRVNGSRSSASR